MAKRPPTTGPSHPDVEIARTRTVSARHLRIDTFRFRHRLFSGEWSAQRNYDVLRRGQAPWQLEAAAGLIDTDETPQAVAVRETREETGLALIGEPIPIQHHLSSAGNSDEGIFLFCSRIDSTAAGGVHGLPEEHEDIRVVVKTSAEIETLLDTGAIESGHTLIGLHWFLRHRDRLRRLWPAR